MVLIQIMLFESLMPAGSFDGSLSVFNVMLRFCGFSSGNGHATVHETQGVFSITYNSGKCPQFLINTKTNDARTQF